MIAHAERLPGSGAGVLRLLSALVILALIFPLGTVVGPLRVVSVDVPFLPLLVVVWFAAARGLAPVPWRPEEWAIPVVLVLLAASSLASLRPDTSFDLWAVWLRASLFYWVLRRLMASQVLPVETLYRYLSTAWGILVFVGLVQVATGSEFGLLANYLGSGAADRSTFGEIRRVSGTTPEANVYGQWIVSLSLLVNTRLLLGRDSWGRLFTIAGLVALELVILAGTLSRANLGFFLLAHALLVVVWIRRSPRGTAVLKSVLTGVAAAVFVATVGALLLTGGVVAALAMRFGEGGLRVVQIQHGLELLKNVKILALGTGLGTFYPTLSMFGIPVSTAEAWHFAGARTGIHNVILLLLVEGGIGTCVAFVVFTTGALRAGYGGVRRGLSLAGTGFWLVLVTYVLIPMQLYMSAVTYPMIFFVMLFFAVAYHTGSFAPMSQPIRARPRVEAT